MEYKASVQLVNKPGNLKAFASVNIGDEFAVKGIRIFEGENGTFVSMPSRKVGENYEDLCFPVTAEAREKLHGAVLKAYEHKLSQMEEQTNGKKQENEADSKGKSKGKSQKNGSKQENSKEELSEENQSEEIESGPEMSM